MIEQLFDEIQADIDWRLDEFKKLELISKHLSGDELKIFLKSIFPTIYAHWEGFVISSLKLIFKYLNNLELSCDKYSNIYLTTAYEQTLQSLDSSTQFEKRKKHLNSLYNNFNNKVSFGEKIDTKSNLAYKVLIEIAIKIDIRIEKFESYKQELNDLVNKRNSISHGENAYNFNSFNDIQKYMDLSENLMLDFYSELQDLLNEKKYMRNINND